jgi:hypothetical protein
MSRSQNFSKIRDTTTTLISKTAYPEYDTSVMHSAAKLAEPDL